MAKKIVITDDELIHKAAEIASQNFPNEYLLLGIFLASVMAEIFCDDSDDDSDDDYDKEEAHITFRAGNWRISINTMNDKARLVMFREDVKVIDRVVDNLYKAYDYAFNILVD